jgi:hypothetical protein
MAPLDQKTELHYRQCAMNMAITTFEGQHSTPVDVLATAKDYYEFMTANQMSAPTEDPPVITVLFPAPSGMPAETPDSVMVKEMTVPEMQEQRRRLLFELDVLANAIRSQGAMPC